MAEKVMRTVRMSPDLAARIDEARQGVPFERWARGVFERSLGETHHDGRNVDVGMEGIRSSGQVKRNIDPIPKGRAK